MTRCYKPSHVLAAQFLAHSSKSGEAAEIEREMARLERFSEFTMRGPFMEEFGFGGKEMHMYAMEFPRMLHHMLSRTLKERKPPRTRRAAARPESDNQ